MEDRLSLLKHMRRRLHRSRLSHQELWERNWASNRSRAPWETDRMPDWISAAIESGWFKTGAGTIDIGCGSGELTALLAGEGFDTLGIDFSASAIDLARQRHVREDELASLRFDVVDICGDTSGLGTFNNVIDRGCFHGLDRPSQSAYGRNVAAMCDPGARLLMMCRLHEVSAATRTKQVRDAMVQFFDLEPTEEVKIDYEDGGMDGLAFWMTRS